MENSQTLSENIQVGIQGDAGPGERSFEGLFSIRNFKSEDANLIYASFLRGIYYGESFFSKTPKNLFMDRYKRVIQALLSDINTAVLIACLPDDPDTILGYALMSRNMETVYYVFVKDRWRNRGIAKALIPRDFKYIVPQHLTKVGRKIVAKLNVTENPFF